MHQHNSNYVIIVAGGSGSRMQSAVPKQFLLLNGLPVLMHTMLAFQQSRAQPHLIVVLPTNYHHYWQQLCNTHNFKPAHVLVEGGATRFHSVKNGLDTITDTNAVIAVHDAVRPLISPDLIHLSYAAAAEKGNATVAVKSRDSIRRMHNGASESLLRDEIYLVQTPQIFQSAQLKKAYEQTYTDKFTDDASVVEETGVAINLIEGDHRNIKITFPEDIAVAEMILKNRNAGINP